MSKTQLVKMSNYSGISNPEMSKYYSINLGYMEKELFLKSRTL